jgi:hypothetical protein
MIGLMARPSPRSPTLTLPDVAALLALFDDEPPPPAGPSPALNRAERLAVYEQRHAEGVSRFHANDGIQPGAPGRDGLPSNLTD